MTKSGAVPVSRVSASLTGNDQPLPGAAAHDYLEVGADGVQRVAGGVIDESLLAIYVNFAEVASVMCSPLDEEALAVGFLYNEGLIQGMDDIRLMRFNARRSVLDVLLRDTRIQPARRMIKTSACGGGAASLAQDFPPLESDFRATPEIVFARMQDLRSAAKLYQAVRGVHTAVLADHSGALVSAEDVGRHNAVDKITGKALQQGIATRDRILLTTGRISSEMIHKARRLEAPLVVSRTAPTRIAVELAAHWGICLVGYVRGGSLRVYTTPERLGLDG
jgi:FdhD protein